MLDAQTTHAEAVGALTKAFAGAGLDSPALDARLLVCACLGVDHAGLILHPDIVLGSQSRALMALANRRLAREPIARILGQREFWGLNFTVTPAVLDPRADSETLVHAALACLKDRQKPWRIADLGTGSGALLAALLHELPCAQGVGVDASVAACAVARANLADLGLGARATILEADWAQVRQPNMDLIVSNPPYIEACVIAQLEPEVRLHDPHLALDGGHDGLDAYRSLMPVLWQNLARDGFGVLEIGAGQASDVTRLAQAAGLEVVALTHDLNQIIRVVSIKKVSG